MTDSAIIRQAKTDRTLGAAVHRHHAFSREGVNERLFTWAFRSLVYAQIWEDPVVDMAALDLRPDDDDVVAIASGGCNALSYLTASPASVTAVDLNAAHIALLELKLAALDAFEEYESFDAMFGRGDEKANIARYERSLRPRLSESARRYWDGRDATLQRRSQMFARGLHRHGLLGRFIRAGWLVSRMNGVRFADVLEAETLAEQRAFFDAKLAPLFDRRLVRFLCGRRAALIGLGIPPHQYAALAGDHPDGIAPVLRERLERLVCGFPLRENYFLRQAAGLSYQAGGGGARPPYLERGNYAALRANGGRLRPWLGSVTEYLSRRGPGDVSCFVLLDAQDWMNDGELNALWAQMTRVARPGSRIIFRTAADAPLVEGRVDPAILARWSTDEAANRRFTAQDRSAIYGRFHRYALKG